MIFGIIRKALIIVFKYELPLIHEALIISLRMVEYFNL